MQSLDGSIFRVDPDTLTNHRIDIAGADNPIAVTFDPVERRVYWTENGVVHKGVRSAKLDGTNVTSLLDLGPSASCDGLAMDHLSRLLFYTDAGSRRVAMIALSTHARRTVARSGLRQPRAVALHTRNGVVFWTDWALPGAKIERANYDGFGRDVIISTGLRFPNGLTIDQERGRLYWADAGTDMVEASDLTGANRVTLARLEHRHAFGISRFQSDLYLTDWGPSGSRSRRSFILRLGTGGGRVLQVGSLGERLNDIHAYHGNATRLNGCGSNNGGCQVFCLPLPSNHSKCACPDARRLNNDNRTCGNSFAFSTMPTTPIPTTLPAPNKTCGGHFELPNGTIASPGFPSPHPHGLDCAYVITAPRGQRVTLTFTHLDLETTRHDPSRCPYDYIQILDGRNNTAAPVLGRYCDVTLPLVVRSFTNALTLRFVADISEARSGFQAHYTSETVDNGVLLAASINVVSTRNGPRGKIHKLDPDTLSGYPITLGDPNSAERVNPVSLTVDPAHARLYWSDVAGSQGHIRSAPVAGGHVDTVYSSPRGAGMSALTLDPHAGLLFFAPRAGRGISMVKLTAPPGTHAHGRARRLAVMTPHGTHAHGRARRLAVMTPDTADDHAEKTVLGGRQVRALTLDTRNGVMYWVETGPGPAASIKRAGYDGSNRSTVVQHDLFRPQGLAVDTRDGWVFWIDTGTKRVEVGKFDGSERRRTLHQGATTTYFYSLSLLGNSLFVTDWGPDGEATSSTRVVRLTLRLRPRPEVTEVTEVGVIPARVNDLVASPPAAEQTAPNGCAANNGGCRVMCIPLPGNRTKCACPDGQALAADGSSCVQDFSTTTTPRPTTTTPPRIREEMFAKIVPSSPPPFVTDGTRQLALTCQATPSTYVIGYEWNVQCERQVGARCTLRPQPTDDGTVATCTALALGGQRSRTAAFHIDMNYPPTSSPVISGVTKGQVLRAGNRQTLTCGVKGGKPPVHQLDFTCGSDTENATTVRHANGVTVTLEITFLQATDSGNFCSCKAAWKDPQIYARATSLQLRVVGDATLPTSTLSTPPYLTSTFTSTFQAGGQGGQSGAEGGAESGPKATAGAAAPAAAVVGAALGGAGIIVVALIVLVLALVIRKKRRRLCTDTVGLPVASPEPPPAYQPSAVNLGFARDNHYAAFTPDGFPGDDPYTVLSAGGQGGGEVGIFNPAYGMTGAEGGEGEENARNEAVYDNAAGMVKTPPDPRQTVSATEDPAPPDSGKS